MVNLDRVNDLILKKYCRNLAGGAQFIAWRRKNEGKVEVKMDKNETKCYKMFQTLFIKRVGRKTKAPIREQPTGLKPDSQINRLN